MYVVGFYDESLDNFVPICLFMDRRLAIDYFEARRKDATERGVAWRERQTLRWQRHLVRFDDRIMYLGFGTWHRGLPKNDWSETLPL